MPDTFVRTRCTLCHKVLSFDDFATGGPRCVNCSRGIVKRNRNARPPVAHLPRRREAELDDQEAYERLLDGLPEELVDELVAALESEAAKLPPLSDNPVRDVLSEIGVGRSGREKAWAAWGFAAGFAGNVAIAKYAQMAAHAPMGRFLAPMVIGGVVAGLCCAAIGWGLARLREPGTA